MAVAARRIVGTNRDAAKCTPNEGGGKMKRIPIDEANNAFAAVEPLVVVARCDCGADIRYFRRTWEMLLDQSERASTRAVYGPDTHTLVLQERQVVRIECACEPQAAVG